MRLNPPIRIAPPGGRPPVDPPRPAAHGPEALTEAQVESTAASGSALCGQLALAYVCRLPIETVLRLTRTAGAMTYAQLRSFAPTFADMRPTEIPGAQLRENPRMVWHTYGGERFLAILPDVDVARPDIVGHVLVMDGRTIIDMNGPQRPRPVNINVLAGYPLALVFSAEVGR